MIEYMTLNVTLYLDDKALNDLGREGWELAHIIPDPDGDVYMRYIFMRDQAWAQSRVAVDKSALALASPR